MANFVEQFEHYCPNIDPKVRDFMVALVSNIAERVSDDFDVTMDDEPDIIPGIPLDGFIPFTDGGCEYVLPIYMFHCYDGGSLPSVIQAYVDESRHDCESDFLRDNNLSELPDTDTEMWDEFCDFATEWESNDDSCWFIKVRAMQKEGKVMFFVFVNTDFGYGRDSLASAGMPNVDPNCNDTEATWWTSDVEELDPDSVANDLWPLIQDNLYK